LFSLANIGDGRIGRRAFSPNFDLAEALTATWLQEKGHKNG
jgi:hypothetical protein